jgi:anti-sigma factor RsiW
MPDPQQTLLDDEKVREELVAYLDGELPPEENLRIERRLAEDGLYRQTLQELERAWDLLDALPRTQPDENFTRTTVEMVVTSAAEDVENLKSQSLRRRRLAMMTAAAAIVVAALVGFSAVYWKTTAPNRQLVRDLPVIENMEYYRHAEDLEFLRRLNQEALFEEDVNHASP